MVTQVLRSLEKLGDQRWIRSRCAVIGAEECWPYLHDLDPNLSESGRSRWLLKIAESIKFKDAAGLGTLAYVASKGDLSVLDGSNDDRAIKIIAAAIKRPDDYWNWLIEIGRTKGISWQVTKVRSFVPWATWPWDKAFIFAAAYLSTVSDPSDIQPTPIEIDQSDFPFWVAIDKHTDEGKIALRTVAKKIGCPYRQLNWVSYYCESATVNGLRYSPWWEREKQWRLHSVGLNSAEAEQLWSSARIEFKQAVEEYAEILRDQISGLDAPKPN